MIYSITLHKEVPIKVEKGIIYVENDYDDYLTRYTVYDAKSSKEVGYVDLVDTRNGAKVSYIKNQQPKFYKHFAQVADQIEVEHCLERGIRNPYIYSVAAIGTHINHFRRGKRFIDEGINIYFETITKNLLKGEEVITEFLGYQKMYMPINLVNLLKEKIKKAPFLRGVK